MEAHSHRIPLLPPTEKKTKANFVASFFKISMLLISIIWASLLFLFPADFISSVLRSVITDSDGTLFGITGSFFLLFSGPLLAVALMASVHRIIFREDQLRSNQKKLKKAPRFGLFTFPILVEGPFGVVSAAEIIGILVFIAFIIWSVTSYTISNFHIMSKLTLSPNFRSSVMLELTGLRFGTIGLLLLAFLFIPIARGSVLLRVIDIPFEQATRYHVWLGHLTMFIFTLHGSFYVIAWAVQGRLIQKIFIWQNIGICNLAGVISLMAGLLMWVTSLPPVRKQNFELFFYTHQLYMIFVLFFALHVGDFIFSIAAGGIFLFVIDRFLRFCQSGTTVDIISATCFPCGILELVIAKPLRLRYNALSYIFVQVPKLSWLQWHPFSVSSSPRDGDRHVSVLIKVLGGWTEELMKHISLRPSKIGASVEGPYGHESTYHLTFGNLILVAGGIGISPFIAMMRDIFHVINGAEDHMRRNILVIWSIKTSDELPLLSIGDMELICPFHSDKLNLQIQIYVTREMQPPLEECKTQKTTINPYTFPDSSASPMSCLGSTGDQIWSALYLVSSILGFIILMAFVDIYYINPNKVSCFWYKGLIFVSCMVLSVPIFGGAVIAVWKLWDTRLQNSSPVEEKCARPFDGASFSGVRTISYGHRPDFKEILEKKGQEWGKVNIGVIVCGPPSLEIGVAKECRTLNFKRKPYKPIFHFFSHTFDL